MSTLSAKFPSDGLFRVGSLMLIQTDEGFALQNVQQVTQEGVRQGEATAGEDASPSSQPSAHVSPSLLSSSVLSCL